MHLWVESTATTKKKCKANNELLRDILYHCHSQAVTVKQLLCNFFPTDSTKLELIPEIDFSTFCSENIQKHTHVLTPPFITLLSNINQKLILSFCLTSGKIEEWGHKFDLCCGQQKSY